LKVLGLGHLKLKGKPLKNDVGKNTRCFQDANTFFIHIETRLDIFHLEIQNDVLFYFGRKRTKSWGFPSLFQT
jgi:hypothetical protein